MKSNRTSQYAHVRTMKDLENEIIRSKLKKNLLEQELENNVRDFKQSMRPVNVIREAFGMSGRANKFQFLNENDNIFNNGKIFTWLKYLALTVSTVKGGSRIVRSVKRIFS